MMYITKNPGFPLLIVASNIVVPANARPLTASPMSCQSIFSRKKLLLYMATREMMAKQSLAITPE